MNEEKNWYVVYTRPRWEKKVALLFENRGMEHYCPLNKVMKQWSDRRKVIMEPLFRGYVFVKLDEQIKWEVKNVDGVLNFVYWLGKPARVKQEEIDLIRKFLSEFESVDVTEAGLKQDDQVRIKQGILMDYKGIVIEVSGNKAKVKIQSLGIELSATFDVANLSRINHA